MKSSAELKDLMLKSYEAISKGDLSFLEKTFSDQSGMLLIGTDPKEWWADRNDVFSAWKAQMEEIGGAMRIESTNLQVFENGDVGWTADQVIGHLPGGAAIPFRMTAVLEKEAQGWKIVQMHSSIGIPNESITGQKPTV
jgi:hypothetical protein